MTVSDLCQRWHRKTPSWRHASAGGFDPARYAVSEIAEAHAQRFVADHHYLSGYPSARFRYGLLDRAPRAEVSNAIALDGHAAWLVGVAVLGVPMNRPVLTNPFPGFTPYYQSIELSRLVLLDEVASNAESWFVEKVFRRAAAGGIRGVIAFSDPVPRPGPSGRLIMPGHVGTVYQALNGWYLGRSTPSSDLRLADGSDFSRRTRSKVTGRESGHRAVVNRLAALYRQQHGHDPAAFTDDTNASNWLRQVLDGIGYTRVRHRGKHRYAFLLNAGDRRHPSDHIGLRRVSGYPKLPDAAEVGS